MATKKTTTAVTNEATEDVIKEAAETEEARVKSVVVRKFKDKYTDTIHKVGEIIDTTEERFEEINSAKMFTKKIEE